MKVAPLRPEDGADAESAAAAPLQARGRFFTAVVLPVVGAADQSFYDGLDAMLRKAPNFFTGAPLVIDLEQAGGLRGTEAFAALAEGLRARNLSPIGVQNGAAQQALDAAGAGLVALQGGRDAPPQRAAPAKPKAVEPPPGALLVTEPVRSGQRIYAEDGDLVVVASVGSGAELAARGNIHVYGVLRGRALAGVHGDRTARIFCQSLEAELVAIAGLYRTNEDFGPDILRARAQAFLQDDDLRIEPLK